MKSEKVTERRRWYDDACGAAMAMDLVGERWSLLILRELVLGARRFGELRAGLPGISANVLTQRLEGMEASGLVVRRRLPPPASVQVYALTPFGQAGEPALLALARWAYQAPGYDTSLHISASAMMLSLRANIDRAGAVGLAMTIGFAIGDDRFVARVADGDVGIVRGEGAADVTFTGSTRAIASVVYGKAPFDHAAEPLTVHGNIDLARRFITLFALPQKVAVE